MFEFVCCFVLLCFFFLKKEINQMTKLNKIDLFVVISYQLHLNHILFLYAYKYKYIYTTRMSFSHRLTWDRGGFYNFFYLLLISLLHRYYGCILGDVPKRPYNEYGEKYGANDGCGNGRPANDGCKLGGNGLLYGWYRLPDNGLNGGVG